MNTDENFNLPFSKGEWRPFGVALAIVALALPILVYVQYSNKSVWLFIALYINLTALSVYDLRSFRLPNLLNLSFLCLAAIIVALFPMFPLSWHVIGAAVGFLFPVVLNWIYFKIRGRDGIGMGDAKLLGGAGLLIGWPNLPLILTVASILGLAFALTQQFKKRSDGQQIHIPFGPFIAFATIVLWLLK